VKKKRFSAEQIVAILKQAKLGIPISELIRQVGGFGTDFLPVEEEIQQHGGRLGAGA